VKLIRDGDTLAAGGFVGIGFAEEIVKNVSCPSSERLRQHVFTDQDGGIPDVGWQIEKLLQEKPRSRRHEDRELKGSLLFSSPLVCCWLDSSPLVCCWLDDSTAPEKETERIFGFFWSGKGY
jgi:hypothetical protein